MSGIFIIKGMTVSVSDFTLSISGEGETTAQMTLQVSYDACIAWARIAIQNRNLALKAMDDRQSAWGGGATDEAIKAASIEAEFSEATQAIVSAAICIDAFYDHVARHAPISSAVRRAWKEKKVARYSQIAETLRSTFKIKKQEFAALRDYLKLLFKLRDAAVHPSNIPGLPYPYPELGISTDWRLVAFRGDIADNLTSNCFGMLWDLSHGTRYRTSELSNFMTGFRRRVEVLFPDGRPTPVHQTVSVTIPK